MLKSALFILSICLGFPLFSQKTSSDSLDSKLSNPFFGSEKQISIRAGIGIQKSIYTELGLAWHKCNYSDVGFFSNDFYGALEWSPNKSQNIYAVKVGYEANAYLLNLGLEIKYQTDFKNGDFVITPKIGLGLFGDLNVFYGYNISTNNRPFIERIGRHQFSIVFNFNKHFLSYQ